MTTNKPPRKITVQPQDKRWQEYDREVEVELHHNVHQSTTLRLSRQEAKALHQALSKHLGYL